MYYLFTTLVFTLATSQSDVCKTNGTCLVMDDIPEQTVSTEIEETPLLTTSSTFTSQVPSTESTVQLTTTPISTTMSTPKKATPSVPYVKKHTKTTVVCWCDVTIDICDINCCCDRDCSDIQKEVFTHCSEFKSVYDLKSCYSSDLFYMKPKTINLIEDNDLFCVVRENVAMMKEFKQRNPIRTVEEFDRELKRKKFVAFPRKEGKNLFSNGAYKSGSIVLTSRIGSAVPLVIPQPLSGEYCLSSKTVVFLSDVSERCIVPSLGNTTNWLKQVILDYAQVKLISSPLLINMTDVDNSIKDCSSLKSCVTALLYICTSYPSTKNCVQSNSSKAFQGLKSTIHGAAIDLVIHHNGSQGIASAETRIWSITEPTLHISVKFLWANTSETFFVRSGNPGYLNGKPILAGKKVTQFSNETATGLKEAIQLTYDPKGWLTTFDIAKGECSNVNRQPILFNDRKISSCSLKLEKKFFDKNGCLDLQGKILEHLLGVDFAPKNLTAPEINMFVGCYGNSRVEALGDWLQVVVDSFPLLSSQVTFEKSYGGLWCNGVITSLYIDIAFSKFGSFANPQAKIVGVLFRFGRARNIMAPCYSGDCVVREKMMLRSFVNFVDLSTPPVHRFAHPPGIDAKLPHDFFYPFFSGRGNYLNDPGWCVLVSIFVLNLLL